MSLVVNHNMMAMNAARNLTQIYGRLSKSVQRLSSGLRVNSAADDAAGLAIRELMRADIAVLNQGVRNAADGISMIQTAEGAMSVIDEKLTRMKELAEQAATGTYTTAQREIMNSEYQAMAAEIDRIANATDFNGVKLLDGSFNYMHGGNGMKIHFGTGNDRAEDYYFVQMSDMRASTATGLRIGAGENYWQSQNLDATSGEADLGATGYFGIEFSTDGGQTWDIYGYVDVNSGDSIDQIASEIDAGRHATGALQFDVAFTSANANGATFTIGSEVFQFTSASSTNTFTVGATTSLIGIGGAGQSMTTILNSVAAFFNNNAVSTGFYAAVSGGDTLNLMAYEGGSAANTSTLAHSSASLFTETAFANGGAGVVSAEAETNLNGEWELRISAYGDNMVRVFSQSSAGGAILDATGGAPTSPWGLPVTNSSGSAVLAAFSGSDAVNDWTQVNADWDGQNINTQSAAQLALAAVDDAIVRKDIARANLGAFANRLENTITNQRIQAENLQAAESRISDVDVALEMTEFTRNNIMAQAAVAMLAQANSLPSLALSLLGG